MKKLLLITALCVSLLSNLMAGGTPPTLTYLSSTEYSITLQLTAGSEPTIGGFDLLWFNPATQCTMVYPGGMNTGCNNVLLPGQSTILIIGPVDPNSQNCKFTTCPLILPCDTPYAIKVVLRGLGTESNTVFASTEKCD